MLGSLSSMVNSLGSMSLFPSSLTTPKNDTSSKTPNIGLKGSQVSPVSASALQAAPSNEAWTICWPVIAAFAAKSNNKFPRYCMLCHTSVPAENFCSTFVSEAVAWSCSHQEKGIICSACDDDFLLRVSLQRQKCLEQGCKGDLSVKMEVVEEKMGAKSLAFKRYRDMVTVECVVCCEWAFPVTRGVTLECAHKRSICKRCLEEMISVAVKRGGWDKLKCPEERCKKKLEFEDVRAASSREVFVR